MAEAPQQDCDPPFPVVTAEEFAATNIEAVIKNKQFVDMHPLMRDFMEAAHTNYAAGAAAPANVFNLLQTLCGVSMKPDDPGSLWGSHSINLNGQRTLIPSDLIGLQTDVLVGVVPNVKHAPLRARLADVVWTNSRRRAEIAAIAIDAYCECVEALLARNMSSEYQAEEKVPLEAVRLARRALQIAYAISKKKKGNMPARPQTAFKALYDAARGAAAFVAFKRAAETGLYYELVTVADVAKDAEAVAGMSNGKVPFAIRPLYDMAAQLYHRVGDEESERRCRLAAVEQILLMRGQVGSAGAEATWVIEALQELRFVKGVEEKEEELERELRRLQRASVKEMKAIPIDLQVEAIREEALNLFSEASLKDALRDFARLDNSPSVEDLKMQALDLRRAAPLGAMTAAAHMDGEGKTIRKTGGASSAGEPPDDWYVRMIDQLEQMRRLRDVAGRIDPARITINARFGIEAIHIEPVVAASVFSPADQKPILTLGFTRFFQGDMMSATHLVIPQLEPSLRHILKMSGVSPVRRFDDGTEEERDLVAMLAYHKSDLEKLLGPNIVAEIERLFHTRPGPALRHEYAHGLASAGACFSPSAVYGVWLMYRITWLLASGHWQYVEPLLDAVENA